jgi:hypothetical protein
MKKASYKLTFEAWADQAKQLLITVSKNYSDWSAWVTKTQNISTSRKKYELTLNMPVNDSNVRLYFGIGRFLGKFYIDNISFTQIEPVTAIKETNLSDNLFSVYPNPAVDGTFKVYFTDKKISAKRTLEMFSIDGKLLYQTNLTETETETEINPGKIKPGIYLVQVKTNKNFSTTRLVIN